MKKTMLLPVVSLGLLLTACPGDPTPSAPTAVTSVSGSVAELDAPSITETAYTMNLKPWTGSAGVINGQIGSSATGVKLGDLNASGAFTATLPQPAAADLNPIGNLGSDPGCTAAPTYISDLAARVSGLSVSVDVADPAKDGFIAPFMASGSLKANPDNSDTIMLDMQFGLLIYADRAVKLTSQETCTETLPNGVKYPLVLSLNLDLAKGWNLVSMKSSLNETFNVVATTGASGTTTMTSGSLPTNTWVWGSPSAMPLSLGHDLAAQVTPAAMLRQAQRMLR